jgi:hypothetical protein
VRHFGFIAWEDRALAAPDNIEGLLQQADELVTEEETLQHSEICDRVVAIGERLQTCLWQADRQLALNTVHLAMAAQRRREIYQVSERLDRVLQQMKLTLGYIKPAPPMPQVDAQRKAKSAVEVETIQPSSKPQRAR